MGISTYRIRIHTQDIVCTVCSNFADPSICKPTTTLHVEHQLTQYERHTFIDICLDVSSNPDNPTSTSLEASE